MGINGEISFEYLDSRRLAERTASLEESEAFVQCVLDSVSSQIAVINQAGTILAVNEAWRQFSLLNSPIPGQLTPHTDVGTNYFEVCCSDSTTDSEGAVDAHDGIRAVIEGSLPRFSLEYPCHSPLEKRWFMMTATPLYKAKKGAVIVHNNITERKNAEEQIRNLAYYDCLTQLPNRRMLNDRLALAQAGSKRTGHYGALMLLDLDNFKPLNDTHGHALGDLLLIEAARRLCAGVRDVDTVARLGGDEFVVVLGSLSTEEMISRTQAHSIAEKIRSALNQPYVLALDQDKGTIEYQCSASIGVTLFIGLEANQNEILKQADDAMYLAKESGRNSVRFFNNLVPLHAPYSKEYQ